MRRELGLTDREIEVLRLVAEGLDAKGMAHALGLSVHTVRGHVQSILVKTGTHSKLHAVMRGLDAGIVRRP
jgi:two-component system nitrate/nitrite response regulator NarL